MSRTLSINIGSVNTRMAVMEPAGPVIVPNREREPATPSMVAFAKTGECMAGEDASRQALFNPLRTVSNVWQELGSSRQTDVDGSLYSPAEVAAILLQRLREDAQAWLGEDYFPAVFVVPASFSPEQRRALEEAGRLAGLEPAGFLDEPAAVLAGAGLGDGARHILLCDMGGSRFDVTVLESGGGAFRTLAAVSSRVGGEDYDRCIARWLMDRFFRDWDVDLSCDPAAAQRIREGAEAAKLRLSQEGIAEISLPYIAAGRDGPLHLEYTLTRALFSEITAHLTRTAAAGVQQALARAGVVPGRLDGLVTAGGAIRIPAVAEAVALAAGVPVPPGGNPEERAVLGACAAQARVFQPAPAPAAAF